MPAPNLPGPDTGITAEEFAALLQLLVDQMTDIMSFGLGALTAIAFVIAAAIRWDS